MVADDQGRYELSPNSVLRHEMGHCNGGRQTTRSEGYLGQGREMIWRFCTPELWKMAAFAKSWRALALSKTALDSHNKSLGRNHAWTGRRRSL